MTWVYHRSGSGGRGYPADWIIPQFHALFCNVYHAFVLPNATSIKNHASQYQERYAICDWQWDHLANPRHSEAHGYIRFSTATDAASRGHATYAIPRHSHISASLAGWGDAVAPLKTP